MGLDRSRNNMACGAFGIILVCLVVLSGCTSSSRDESPTGSDAPSGVLVAESLQNKSTVGEYRDGAFTENGILFRGVNWYLKYHIPTTPDGYIEFTAKGFVSQELHDGDEFIGYLLSMWDSSYPFDYDRNPFIFEVFKFGYIPGRPDATDSLFLGVTSHGRFADSSHHGFYKLDWEIDRSYRFRLEWSGKQGRVYRDGVYIGSVEYYDHFTPASHTVQIGANNNNTNPRLRREGPRDLLISDVVIGSF